MRCNTEGAVADERERRAYETGFERGGHRLADAERRIGVERERAIHWERQARKFGDILARASVPSARLVVTTGDACSPMVVAPETALAVALAEIEALREKVRRLEWATEMACENTPTRGCECPGCTTARERAEKGETGP